VDETGVGPDSNQLAKISVDGFTGERLTSFHPALFQNVSDEIRKGQFSIYSVIPSPKYPMQYKIFTVIVQIWPCPVVNDRVNCKIEFARPSIFRMPIEHQAKYRGSGSFGTNQKGLGVSY